ncbi:MAG: hypothetical protein U0794_13970 [Isosphaeraceae bacterium]
MMTYPYYWRPGCLRPARTLYYNLDDYACTGRARGRGACPGAEGGPGSGCHGLCRELPGG